MLNLFFVRKLRVFFCFFFETVLVGVTQSVLGKSVGEVRPVARVPRAGEGGPRPRPCLHVSSHIFG